MNAVKNDRWKKNIVFILLYVLVIIGAQKTCIINTCNIANLLVEYKLNS